MHAGRSSWFRSKDGIFVFEFFIGVGKFKVPETVNDIPNRPWDGVRIRIIFTEIVNNKVLTGGMTAGINR